MATDRIKQLEQFYAEDPQDPFNLYALALEYLQTNPARSQSFFEALLETHRDYLPTYYHAARFFQDKGEKQRSIIIFEDGIALAEKLNDRKTLRELRSAYDELMFE